MRKFSILATLTVSFLMTSCPTEHPTSLVVLNMGAMSRITQCSIQNNATIQYIRPFGILDLAVTNHYLGFPIVYSNLPKSSEISGERASSLEVETNYINIRGAHVRLDIPMKIYSDPLSNKKVLYPVMTDGFFTASSTTVEPKGKTIMAIEVIPPDVGNVLRTIFKAKVDKDACSHPSALIYAYITVKGTGVSGNEIDSGEFMFPIRLCWGCLIRYVAKHPDSVPPSMTAQQAPCLPGQDEAMDNVLCLFTSMDKRVCYDRCAKKNL